MSRASKCDCCGDLFEVEFGVVTMVDIQVADNEQDKEGDQKWQGWSEVDFCPKCSKKVLDLIAPALQELRRP